MQAPSAPTGLTASAVSSSQIDLTWTASTDNGGVTQYKIYRNGSLLTILTGAPPTTSFFDTGLALVTSYSYTVAACDAAGNCSAQSTAAPATTQTLPNFGLTVTNVGGGTVSSSPAGISCGTSCSAPFSQGTVVTLTASPSAGFSLTSWSGSCTGTGVCTVTIDAAKNVTATFADTQAPSVPTGLTASAVSTLQINVTWSASTDNVGLSAYQVFRGGVFRATVNASTLGFSDTGLTASTPYSYTVAACDAAGNCSGQSNSASATPGELVYTPNLVSGFNLIGNSLNITIDVAATFGNQTAQVTGITSNIVSIWKWNAVHGRWAFHSPQLTVSGIITFAVSKGYEVLATINPGEGYWVNAVTQMTLPAQTGTGYNWSGFSYSALPSGFNLISHANTVTPSQFNILMSVTPPSPGAIPTDNFLTLWAWDAAAGNWYFYSPLLEASGGLAAVKSYADSKFYRHFQDFNKTLGIGVGFWVNKP